MHIYTIYILLGGATVSRRSTIGGSPSPTPFQYNQLPPLGPGRSPQLPSRFGHNYHDNQGGFQRQHGK